MRILFCVLLMIMILMLPAVSLPAAEYRRSYVEDRVAMKFVYLPPGFFTMGSKFAETVANEAERKFFLDEMPIHQVAISQGLWVSETEVTVKQFRKFAEETGYITTAERKGESLCKYTIKVEDGKQVGEWVVGEKLNWREPGWPITDRHPVTHVSWQDAMEFCQWLADKTGRQYRLPTEAEWEYASGGPTHTVYAWGNDPPEKSPVANIADFSFSKQYPEWKYPVLKEYDDGQVWTAPVASYLPNQFGLYDLTGNVWEWCSDLYSNTFYTNSPSVDPHGPSQGTERVHRGGGFDWELPYLRVSKRRRGAETLTACNIGFRVVVTINSIPQF